MKEETAALLHLGKMYIESIHTTTHDALPFVRRLYEENFLPHERREWNRLMSMLNEPSMQLGVVMDDIATGQLPVGFIVWWQLGSWYYIEHLAVDTSLRSMQYGTHIIQYMIKASDNKLVLESAFPDSIDKERTIRFYERLGLRICPYPYMQPPYRQNQSPTPMVMMSLSLVTEEKKFDELVSLIKHVVYEQFY